MGRFRFIGGIVSASLMSSVSAFAAVKDSDFARAHAELLKHTDYQFSFDKFVPPKTPDWMLALGAFLDHYAPLLKWPFWIMVALIGLYVAYLLIRKYGPLLAELQRGAPMPRGEPEWRPTQAEARRLLEEADALAARWKYAEAVHLLLLRSIEDIEAHRPRHIHRTMTSREIGRLDALPQSARSAFAGIVHTVELSRFAGAAVTADDFARCRRDYEAFAFPPVWQAAA